VFATSVVTREVIDAGAVIGRGEPIFALIQEPINKSVAVVVVTDGATNVLPPMVPTTSTAAASDTAKIDIEPANQFVPTSVTDVSTAPAVFVSTSHCQPSPDALPSEPRTVQPTGVEGAEPDFASKKITVCITRMSPDATPAGIAQVIVELVVVMFDAERNAGPDELATGAVYIVPTRLGLIRPAVPVRNRVIRRPEKEQSQMQFQLRQSPKDLLPYQDPRRMILLQRQENLC
jgi:hypothetical protein